MKKNSFIYRKVRGLIFDRFNVVDWISDLRRIPPSSRLVEGRRYFDFSEPKYSDMTPIYQLAKEFMKGREAK